MHFKNSWRHSLAGTQLDVPWGAVIVFLIFAAGCDSLPEEVATISRPPTLSNFTYTPRQFDLGTAQPGTVVSGLADIDFAVGVDASDPDGSVSQVNFVLRPPAIGSAPLVNLEMNDEGNGHYSLSHTQQVLEGETGNYTIELYAVDNTGMLSNRVLGTFTLLNVQDPPVIDSVEAPDVVQRPADGSVSFQLIAVVSDPQGVANISTVLAWNVNDPQATFGLFDDGAGGDDETPGDGRFTATVMITADNAPGVNTLAFQATDRSGLRSEAVTVDITIE